MKTSLFNKPILLASMFFILILASSSISPAKETGTTPTLTNSKELASLNQAIKANNASWSAGATTMLALSPQERQIRVGLLKPSLDAQTQVIAQAQADATSVNVLAAPTGPFDWRNFGGTNYVSAVRDQGACGSCWAFAATAALESYVLIHGAYNAGLDLSEQILVSCSGAGSCSGGYVDRVSSYIQGTGLPAEAADPYTATNSSCSIAALNWQNSTSKISSWRWVTTSTADVASIKNALYTYGPLMTTMNVYADFYSYRSGVYHYVSGSMQGGHAILIVGYTDDGASPGGGYFTVKNSWGTGWGEAGYFRIAYSELNSVVQFGHWTIAYDTSSPPAPSTGVTLTPSIASPQTVGATVTFTAAGSGGTGSYDYQFQILPPGGTWAMKQDYSSTSTWSWNTAGLAVGTYSIFVGARTAGTSPANGYDVYKIISFTISAIPPATGITVTPSVASPQLAGTTVTFTAAGSGGSGSYDYQFWFQPAGGTWVMKQNYGSGASWSWNTAGLAAGTYTVQVLVKTAGSSPSAGYDVYKNTSYTITTNAATGITVTPSVASPQLAGTTVTFTAAGSGGSGSYDYQFWFQPAGGTWVMKQNYGSGASWSWNTAGLAAGTYTVQVLVKTAGSSPSAGYDVYKNTSYTITTNAATGITVTPSVASPQLAGTTVTFTAAGSGGSGSYDYQFWFQPAGGTWVMKQNYGSGASWSWNTAGLAAGTYTVQVLVKTAGSSPSAGYDVYKNTSYTITTNAATGITVTPSVASPQLAGTTVTFTAAGSGGSGSYDYQFWFQPAGGTWVMKQNYGSGASWSWNTAGLAAGTYTVQVLVKTAGSSPSAGYDVYKNTSYTITTNAATGITVTPSVASPQLAGTTVTFTAAGSGGSGSYDYQFWFQPAGGTWVMKQNYGSGASWSWNTAGLAAGTYTVQVLVKTAGSSPSAGYDVYKNTSYTITTNAATGITVTPSVASPQLAGTTVTFTAAGSGGSGSYDYQFWFQPAGGTWVMKQNYGSGASWSWNTAGLAAGTYTVQVLVKTAGSSPSAGYDVYKNTSYTIN